MKKIIALAIASAFVAPAVMAEVTIYGSIRTAVEYSKISSAGANDLSRVRFVDESSRIGFKGTDKLDSGLETFWQIENKIRIGTGDQATGWLERNNWVGVRGAFGEVKGGKFDDVLDQSNGDFFPGITNYGDTSDGVGSMIRPAKQRINNIVEYTSPNIAGFNGKVAYDFGTKTTTANYYGVQASAWYQSDLFRLGAAYKRNTDNATSGTYTKVDSASASGFTTSGAGANIADGNYYKSLQIGANVTPIANLNIAAVWNTTKSKLGATATRQNVWGFGAEYVVGKNGFNGTFSKVGAKDTTANSGAWGVEAGYKYMLSKQTQVNVNLAYVKNQSAGSNGNPSTAFTASPAAVTVPAGAKTVAAAVGLRTDF